MNVPLPQTICIVEDDSEIRAEIRSVVESLHLPAAEFGTGKAALNSLAVDSYSLLVLDVGLPDISGFEICRMIRDAGSSTPIVFVTSRVEDEDRILGLSSGADDYVTKPFNPTELGLRIRAILRRSGGAAGMESADSATLPVPLHFGPLTIDPDRRQVSLRGKELPLTPLEFEVLYFLALNAGRPFNREELAQEVWGIKSSQFGPTVTTLMNRLRKKVEPDLKNPVFIRTVYGVGYRFVDPSVEPIDP